MLQRRQNQIMMNILKPLSSSRIRISVLLTVSILAMLFCCINLPIVYVGLIEALALAGCIAFFRKVDVTQYELFQYKPHWFWRICEWYWTVWFCFKTLPFITCLGNCYPTLKYAYFVYPSIFKSITDFAISNFGKVIAVRYMSTIMLAPIIILTMPIIYYCFRWLFKQIAEFFQSFTKFEKYFLAISSSVLIAILFIVSSKTSYFVYPVDRELYLTENIQNIVFDFKEYEEQYEFDGVFIGNCFFRSDTPHLLINRYYLNNNLDYCRHPYCQFVLNFFNPLFYSIAGLFSLYFRSFAYCIPLGIAVVQIVLFIISGILLERLFLPIVNNTYSKLIATVYVCSFPIVFAFCPERLIFSSFFLVLAVYISLNENTFLKSVLSQLCAIGITSLSIAPIFLVNLINKHMVRIIVILSVLLSVSVYRHFDWINMNTVHIHENDSILKKLGLYFQFESSCIMLPNNKICNMESYFKTWGEDFISFRPPQTVVISVPSKIDSAIGIIVFILCTISSWLFRHSKIVLISYSWILISFAIIGIIGFGNSECVLYCSYFSWAVIPLALLPFYWLWQKFPRLPIPQTLYVFAAYLAISNLYFIYQVVQLVSDRYIVPPGM